VDSCLAWEHPAPAAGFLHFAVAEPVGRHQIRARRGTELGHLGARQQQRREAQHAPHRLAEPHRHAQKVRVMLEGQLLQPLAARLPRDAAHESVSLQVRAATALRAAFPAPHHREEVKRMHVRAPGG